jgi:hypothetical protein
MMHFRMPPRLISTLATVLLLGCGSLQAQTQPANPSFSNPVNLDFLGPPTTQFGTFRQGNPGATLNFNVYNLPAATGTTSSMSLVHYPPFSVGDDTAIALQTTNVSALQPVGVGGTPNAAMQLVLSTSQVGNLQVSYTLEFKSDSVTTLNQSIAIAAYATVLRHGDYNADGKVDGGDYVVWRKTRGQSVSPFTRADDNGDGQVTDADYTAWRSAFTGTSGSGSSSLSGPLGVPEPTTAILGLVAALFVSLMTTRKRNRA